MIYIQLLPHQFFVSIYSCCSYYIGGDKPSLNALCQMLPRIASSWHSLGLTLGAKPFTLSLTDQSHKGDPEKCFSEMLQNWLNGKPDCGDQPRTWDSLLQAVDNVVGSEVSVSIKKKILNWEEDGEPMVLSTAESKYNCSVSAKPNGLSV